jgi:hypothetical protein
MSERDRIIDRMANAMREATGNDHADYELMADVALRTLEEQLPTDAEVILPCTCGHNGYGAHKVGCALYANMRSADG